MSCTISLTDFGERFPNEDTCWNHLRELHWGPNDYTCTQCGEDTDWLPHQHRGPGRMLQLRVPSQPHRWHPPPRHQPPLKTWFRAAYLLLTSKKRTSMPRLDPLGVTEKTAHHLRHKLLQAIRDRQGRQLLGLVEADDTYVGGVDPGAEGRGTDKAVVQAWVENRDEHAGRLRPRHRPDVSGESLTADVDEIVDVDEARVRTDGYPS